MRREEGSGGACGHERLKRSVVMAADDRTAAIPYANWTVHEWDSSLTMGGLRPISMKFRTSVGGGPAGTPLKDEFSTAWVKNEGALHTPSFKVVHHKTAKEVIAIATDSGKTAHPLRCISLNSYLPYDASERKYSAIFIENTGAQGKAWYWWFNVPADFILSETDQTKKDKPHYPIRLVHISPTSQPVGEPWNFDIVAVSNTGVDSRWWRWRHNMKLEGVQKFLDDYKVKTPRVYQLANGNVSLQNWNIWTAILVGSDSGTAWFDQEKTFDELMTLAKQRNARILDLVDNYKNGYAATMLKCG
jgi:hypothetical protein